MIRFCVAAILLIYSSAIAGAAHVTYQGRIFDSFGDPVENDSVSIAIQIMDPSAECLLYEETHVVDMSQSSGFFSVQIGLGAQNTTTAPNFTLLESLSNTATFNDVLMGCAGDSYTPTAADKRILRVSIDGTTLQPDQPINSTPYSIFANEADSLGGKSLSQVESEYENYANLNWAGTPLPDIQSVPLAPGDSFKWDGSKWVIFQPGSATGLTDVFGGDGLTDSGTTTKTLNIGAGNGITVNSNEITIDAGDGLQFNSGALEINLGSGLQFNAGAIEVNQSAINYSSISGTPLTATTSINGLMSATDKAKLDDISPNAEVNVNADWNANSGDAQIMNRPTIPTDINDLTVGSDSISGNAIDGGTISSFASSGIDDNAPTISMTIDTSGFVGIGTSTPNTNLEINGDLRLGNSGDSCSSTIEGAMRYSSSIKNMEFCNGTSWLPLGSGLKSIQTFTSDGTWSRPMGVTRIKVICTGAGGGGQKGEGEHFGGSGGGAGATVIKTVDVTSVASVSVDIGAGGQGGSGSTGTPGSDGESSSFGSHLSAGGGAGGNNNGGSQGGTIITSGDVNILGGQGTSGTDGSTSDNIAPTGGSGGGSHWGSGGFGSRGPNSDAPTATAPGSGGGGGGASADSGSGANGGNGADGICVIEEY